MNKILFHVERGIGDQACAEPTVRFAIELFPNADISVLTDYPLFFKHLKLANIFTKKSQIQNLAEYSVLKTFGDGPDCTTNCVDFSSLSALRCQIPVDKRQIKILPEFPDNPIVHEVCLNDKHVVLHCNRNESLKMKTFPKEFWNTVIDELIANGKVPVLIGKTSGITGYVNTKSEGCIDLREKLSLNDVTFLLQHCHYVISGDSFCVHLASSGYAKIGFLSVWKHPDFITHYRDGRWGWNMKNFSNGGVYYITEPGEYNYNPTYTPEPEFFVQQYLEWIEGGDERG